MNNQGGIHTSGTTMVAGVNTIGLLALLAYSVRNINELNERVNALNEEFKTLQTSYVDNAKRTNMLINKLNVKIDNSFQSTQTTRTPSRTRYNEPKIVDVTDDTINEQIDDVTAAIGEMMR
jgi:hypothetical protein